MSDNTTPPTPAGSKKTIDETLRPSQAIVGADHARTPNPLGTLLVIYRQCPNQQCYSSANLIVSVKL